MVIVVYEIQFKKLVSKIRDQLLRDKVKKQIQKIIDNPEIGKPMKYTRKSTREIYISPFRLSYKYFREEDKIVLLDLYHKDMQ